jgi:cobalt-zinc-cadmium efflux system outer membrane protein
MIYSMLRGWQPTAPRMTTVTIILWLTLASTSQSALARSSINLAHALRLTLSDNPELQAYPFDRSRAEALLLQAGIRPTPTAELIVENALGSGFYRGFEASETTLALSQIIELGDKRDHRIALAKARGGQLETEYELTRLDVLAETSRRYYRLLTLQAMQALNERRLTENRQSLSTITNRAAAGAAAQADASKLELRLARSQARAEQLANEHTLARRRLAAMWLGEPGFDLAEGKLGALPSLPNVANVLAKVAQAPRLQQQMALLRLADTRLLLAEANGHSDLRLGLGIRYLAATSNQALVFSASMPLAFDNPNRGRIAAAGADRRRNAMESTLIQRQLQLELAQIHQQLLNNRDRARQVENELLPRARTLVEDTRRGYQQGHYSVLQWTDAQGEHFSLEQELIQLHSAIYLQLLELERISGQSLTSTEQGDKV